MRTEAFTVEFSIGQLADPDTHACVSYNLWFYGHVCFQWYGMFIKLLPAKPC